MERIVWDRSTGQLEVEIQDTGSGSGPIRFDLHGLRARGRRVVAAVETHSGRTVDHHRDPRAGSSGPGAKKLGIWIVCGLLTLVCGAVTVLTWGEGLASGWTDTGWIQDALGRALGGMAVGPLMTAIFALVTAWALTPKRRERRPRTRRR